MYVVKSEKNPTDDETKQKSRNNIQEIQNTLDKYPADI